MEKIKLEAMFVKDAGINGFIEKQIKSQRSVLNANHYIRTCGEKVKK